MPGRGGCVRGRGRAACVGRGWDPSQKVAGPDEGQVDLKRLFFFNVVKEDIICCDAEV